MPQQYLKDVPVWKNLKQRAEIISQPENHLKYLIKQEQRLEKFSLKRGGYFMIFPGRE